MQGQKRIIDKINKWKEIPRFIILSGIKGCGKKTLAKYIANKYNYELVLIGNKVDEIREMNKLAIQSDSNIIFFIDNGNKLSMNAENSLLKITEEAPNNSHIILAVENKDLLLPTIISRGEVITFQDYIENDFKEFTQLYNLDFELSMVYPNLSYLELLPIEEGEKLLTLCRRISSSIRNANGASAFKVTEKIKLKEEQEGYDLFQFIYCLKKVCEYNSLYAIKNNDSLEYNYQIDYIKILTVIQRMLNNQLFNKSYILDKLILDFKGVYYK